MDLLRRLNLAPDSQSVAEHESNSKLRALDLVFYKLDVLTADLFQECFGAFLSELWITSFNTDKKAIIRKLGKTTRNKERMVKTWQTDQCHQTKKRGKGRKENGEFKHHREESRQSPNVSWFALNHCGVSFCKGLEETQTNVRPESGLCESLEDKSNTCARHAAKKDEPRQLGPLHAHGVIHTMDRERTMHIPALIASIANVLGGMVQVFHAVKLGEEAVNSFEGGAHLGVSS